MRLIKTVGLAGALLLSAVIGGTLIGTALAHDETDGADGSTSAYCDTFMEAFAGELGVTTDEVIAAGRTGALAAVDAAVAAGDLSEERAAEIRERIEEADGDGCGWFAKPFGRGFGHGFGHGLARGFLGGDVFEAAADALGIESSELLGELHDAESLEAVAEERGASYDEVKAAILAAVQADLDAVAEGMDQERADAVIERLSAWLDNGGQLDGFRGGLHIRPGPWHGDDDTDDEDAAGT